MFTQSLTKGSEQAHLSLQRLTSFLEAEGESGQISSQLQKKILGMFTSILIDLFIHSFKKQTNKPSFL